MTEYITIPVKKRNFIIPVTAPESSDAAVSIVGSDYTRITRSGAIRITRSGAIRIARNPITAYPRSLKVRKRNFVIVAKVKS